MKNERLRLIIILMALIALLPSSIFYSQVLTDSLERKKHYQPKTDLEYGKTSGYIEDDPIPEYQWASDSAYEAFRDMKYGVRIHWGLYSIVRMQKESWPIIRTPHVEKQKYFDMYKTWNPTGFDAEEWMNLFEESGMKMFAFTTKHHDGFSMYDTKTRVKKRVKWDAPGGPVMEDSDLAFSIMETPFKRDVVKELCDAAHKRNIKIDLYFSNNDWYDADFRPYVWHPLQVPSTAKLAIRWRDRKPEMTLDRYSDVGPVWVPDPTPEEVDRMINRHRQQLLELVSNYGKIDMICLDMQLGPTVWPQFRETLMMIRKIQPDVMLRNRGIGNYGDYYTPEGFVPGAKENTEVPWFVIYPLGRTFSYDPEPAEHKGAKWIVQNVIDCSAKGGNFMVGIGPDGNGKFHPTVIEQLKQAGKWLKVNGEGIYATRARDAEFWKEGDNIRYTRTKDEKTIYAHCFEWPGQELVLKTVKAKEGSKIYLIGCNQEVKWEKDSSGGIVIKLSEDILCKIPEEERLAYSFRIEI